MMVGPISINPRTLASGGRTKRAHISSVKMDLFHQVARAPAVFFGHAGFRPSRLEKLLSAKSRRNSKTRQAFHLPVRCFSAVSRHVGIEPRAGT